MPSVTLVATSCIEDGTVGSGAWTNPSYAITSDLSRATASMESSGVGWFDITKYLKFSGPSPLPTPTFGYKNVVDGVTFYVQGFAEDGPLLVGSTHSYSIRLTSSGNVIVGNDAGSGITVLKDTSNNTFSVGGTSDTWGLDEDMLALVDGGVIAFTAHNKESYVYIDNLWLEMEYHEEIDTTLDANYNAIRRRASFMFVLDDE